MAFPTYRQETITKQEEILVGLVKTGICEDGREKGRLNRVRFDSGKAALFFNVLFEREEGGEGEGGGRFVEVGEMKEEGKDWKLGL